MKPGADRPTGFAIDDDDDDGDRTLIRTTQRGQPQRLTREGWLHNLVYTEETGTVVRLKAVNWCTVVGVSRPGT